MEVKFTTGEGISQKKKNIPKTIYERHCFS
jgi:hypothetical protein